MTSPIDCRLERAGDSASWRCSRCGWQYTGPRPPRRNCPASPGAAEALESRIAEAVDRGEAGLPSSEILTRLARCRDCGDFSGANCPRFDPFGRTPCRWFAALIRHRGRPTHDCEKWKM